MAEENVVVNCSTGQVTRLVLTAAERLQLEADATTELAADAVRAADLTQRQQDLQTVQGFYGRATGATGYLALWATLTAGQRSDATKDLMTAFVASLRLIRADRD